MTNEAKVASKKEETKKPVEKPEEDNTKEPLYQKKVYLIDLQNIGLSVKGEGHLIVDVMKIEKEKATVIMGDKEYKIPKDFLF